MAEKSSKGWSKQRQGIVYHVSWADGQLGAKQALLFF